MVVALFAGIATVWLIDRKINLEVEFFYELSKVTDQWANSLREKGGCCCIVAGGSEIKTTIDPEKLGSCMVSTSSTQGIMRGLVPYVTLRQRFNT